MLLKIDELGRLHPGLRPDLHQCGRFNPILPIGNARRLAIMLREAEAELTFQEIQAGHQLTSAELDAAGDWLAKP